MPTIEEILGQLAICNAMIVISKDSVTGEKKGHFRKRPGNNTGPYNINPPTGKTRDEWAKLLLEHFDGDVRKVNRAIQQAQIN